MTSRSVNGLSASDSEVASPTYRVASYTVYPSGFDRVDGSERKQWTLRVVDAGDGWAIRRGNLTLNFAGEWETEPPPSLRDPGYLHRCRYSERAALWRARRIIDRLPVAGLTFEQYVARRREAAVEQAREYLETQRGVAALKRVLDRMLSR